MSYKEKIKNLVLEAVQNVLEDCIVERTKTKQHGDVATNIAMVLAKQKKTNPLDIASEIKSKIKLDSNVLKNIEIAKPGFINFIVSDYALSESICECLTEGSKYGYLKPKTKEKILVEYVSSNPTGDLHLGHGRQAVLGSSIVNLFKVAGHDVNSEFYINDYGEQISKLSDTTWAIYEKLNGRKVDWGDEFYPEQIIRPYVEKILAKDSKNILKESLGKEVKNLILLDQKNLLERIDVKFDIWFSETDLHINKNVEQTLGKLKEKNCVYENEGAIWFKAKDFGDVRDRVLVRADGRPTYLLSDIAYHVNKFKRGHEKLITIWGADHQGQEISLKGALKALGYDEQKLEIVFVQLVSLKKEGKEFKMSKREGNFLTVKEVLDETGSDAFRYFLVEAHQNNRMAFDVDLAKKQDKDNPVYYIQYAHARCCSIFRQLGKTKNDIMINQEQLLNSFKVNNEEHEITKSLILKILDFPEEVLLATENRAPSRIANYLKELAYEFHQFYMTCRVISENISLMNSRLAIVEATKITIGNGLKILGINAPEAM